jgi:hypothetical protein
MKLFLATSLLLMTSTSVFARGELQLGVVLGAPTGISAKAEIGESRAVDAVLSYSLANDLALEFHSDYLIENAYAININAPSPMQLYFGIGGRVVTIDKGKHDGDLLIGPRAPVGVSYKISNPNLEFFGELALDFDIIPYTNLDLEAGVGVRYRF